MKIRNQELKTLLKEILARIDKIESTLEGHTHNSNGTAVNEIDMTNDFEEYNDVNEIFETDEEEKRE